MTETVEDKILNFLRKAVRVPNLTPEDDLRDFMDSMDTIDLFTTANVRLGTDADKVAEEIFPDTYEAGDPIYVKNVIEAIKKYSENLS